MKHFCFLRALACLLLSGAALTSCVGYLDSPDCVGPGSGYRSSYYRPHYYDGGDCDHYAYRRPYYGGYDCR